MILILVGDMTCTFRTLEGVAKDVGKRLDSIKGKNISLEECENICLGRKDCYSFGYCTIAKNCHIFDKKLDGSEPLKPPNGCYTSFKICKNGMKFSCLIILLIYRLT